MSPFPFQSPKRRLSKSVHVAARVRHSSALSGSLCRLRQFQASARLMRQRSRPRSPSGGGQAVALATCRGEAYNRTTLYLLSFLFFSWLASIRKIGSRVLEACYLNVAWATRQHPLNPQRSRLYIDTFPPCLHYKNIREKLVIAPGPFL